MVIGGNNSESLSGHEILKSAPFGVNFKTEPSRTWNVLLRGHFIK
jgi:hypothetical protein